MITLIARMPLIYRDRAVKRGEVFEARPIDAAALTYSPSLNRPAKARFAPRGTTLPRRPDRVAPAILSAEPNQPTAHPDDEDSDDTPRPRRTYRRRDLVAEKD